MFKPQRISAGNTDFRLYKLLKNDSRFFRITDAISLAMMFMAKPLCVSNQMVCVKCGEVVEDDGIEPTTPCLQSRCSPS